MISIEGGGGLREAVNPLDKHLNRRVCKLVEEYYKNNGEGASSGLLDMIWWYIGMKEKWRQSLPGHEIKGSANRSRSNEFRLAWRIIKDQTPQAVREIRSCFATIKPLTIVDLSVLAFLLAYKIFYSPPNQAKRMLDPQRCQRECSIGFAQWYVHARTIMGFGPNQALRFACTALMAKCEGLGKSNTSAHTLQFWE